MASTTTARGLCDTGFGKQPSQYFRSIQVLGGDCPRGPRVPLKISLHCFQRRDSRES